MQSRFRRAGVVRVVLTASVLVLASCSSSDDDSSSGSGGLIFPVDDASGTTDNTPFTTTADTLTDTTDETPITAIDDTPEAPPVDFSTGYESLYGRATFDAVFIDSDDILSFSASFNEAGLVTDDGGSQLLQSMDTGIYDAFVCSSIDGQAASYACVGIFNGGDLNLFIFDVAGGVGRGVFEECFDALAADTDTCIEDLAQRPDGTLTVTIDASLATAQAVDNEALFSASEFHAMMDVNGQATRFGVSSTEPSAAQTALIAEVTGLLTQVEAALD